MIAELGHFALALALAVALLQAGAPVFASLWRPARGLGRIALGAAGVQCVLIAIAYAALTAAFLKSDFSLALVHAHSHSDKPLAYRIAGVWGNHEGSMLLWVLILSVYGALIARFGGRAGDELREAALAVQGAVGAAFIAFLLFTSNPFLRLEPAPLEGLDLNPVLQDPALVLHPPLLYLGYVGYSVPFAFTVAALVCGRINAAWGSLVRPWALSAWLFLTLGIALGSYWAYYELGWGGYWFWDPVENASLLPWLAGGALLHSAIVVERREALKAWTLLLAVLAFAMSLLGTFLVRSGVLTSVHAFASDPTRGVFILAMFAAFIGGALVLFAWRAPKLSAGGAFRNLSREGALLLNNILLASAAAAVLIGTLYPMVLELLTGRLISVGPPYFDAMMAVLFTPLLLAMPFGPMIAWKRGDVLPAAERLWVAATLAVAAAALVATVERDVPLTSLAALAAGVWLVAGAASDLAVKAGLGVRPAGTVVRRLFALPLGSYGSAGAHAGFGLLLIGMASVGGLQEEALGVLAPGESLEIGAAELRLERIDRGLGPNFDYERAQFTLVLGEQQLPATSERRSYWSRAAETTEVGLIRRGVSQYYVVLGDARQGGRHVVRVHHHPGVLLIWTGALVMALGAAASLLDRRLRWGAAAVRRAPRPVAGAATATP